MTYTVEFGKDHYHLQGEMERWCQEHIGMNPPYRNWVGSTPKEWEGLGTWCIASMFGNTFFYFKDAAAASAFILRWK
jgi:hypothetical protein